ncbi:MAG TPA: hypothetical protein VGO93_21300 [Candidatus Xenobia bacterium]|jgi:hypothetical protein
MQIGSFASLKDFAVRAPQQDREFCDAISDAGKRVIKNALQTYSKANRSRQESDAAVDDLTDLERAFKAVVDRTTHETADNQAKISATVQQLNSTGQADGRLRASQTTPLSNEHQHQVPGWHCYGSSYYGNNGDTDKVIERGTQVLQAETAAPVLPKTDELTGLRSFIGDLHTVAGLYAAAVAIPGIPSVTVDSFAREEMDSTAQEHDNSSFSGTQNSAAASLLLLGGQRSTSSVAGGSTTDASSVRHFDKTSTDERIVPVLRDLTERLDQAQIAPAQDGAINGYQNVHETRTDVQHYGMFKRKTRDVPVTLYWKQDGANSGYGQDAATMVRNLCTEPFEPSHLSVPQNGISAYVTVPAPTAR